MTDTRSLRLSVSHLRGRAAQIAHDLSDAQRALSEATREAGDTDAARALIQRVCLATQSQLRYRVTALGTMALEAVFPEPVDLDLVFGESSGKTDARLLFKRVGDDGLEHWLDPLEEDSGGACNIAGLGLRCAMREVQRPRTRPILVMDEPGHDLNDESREMHRKFAEMIGKVSGKLGVQFLIVTMIKEIEGMGDDKIRIK